MSDEPASEIVRLAVMAAGPVGSNERAWRQRIDEMTPVIAALFRPPVPGRENDATSPAITAAKVLSASVFTGEYVDHTLEESSKRFIVRIKSETMNANERESDGTEHIRTEPMWTPAGRVMKAKLDQLQPGQQVTCFKHNEQIDASRKVRVLAHLEVRGKPANPPSTPSGSPPAVAEPEPTHPPSDQAERRSAGDAPASAPTPGAGPSSATSNAQAVEMSMKDLTARQKIAVRAACQGEGIANWPTPADEDLDKVLVIIQQVAKGEWR